MPPIDARTVAHIFRSYDIRGIYRKDLDEKIMERIGAAFGALGKGDVTVASDVRVSSMPLKNAFVAGLRTSRNVTDAGTLPLGAGMFRAWRNKTEFAYITASHLPKEWNGVKFFHASGRGFSEQENEAVRDSFLKGEIEQTRKGTIKNISSASVLSEYVSFLTQKLKATKKLRIVLDAGNGCAGLVARHLFTKAGFVATAIFEAPDGTFPNRDPEPNEDPLTMLKKTMKEKNADMGIAYDGDGDRMVAVDDAGRVIPPEHMAFFLLTALLETEKGPIVANVECTQLIDDIGKKFQRDIIRVPVGHTFLVQAALEKGAAFGVETSGHYIIPSLLPFDDSLAVSLYAACALSKHDGMLSSFISSIPTYHFKRINVGCSDATKFTVIGQLKKELKKKYDISTPDGIRISLPGGWALIRASNTSPLIRLSIEAKTAAALRGYEKTFVKMLGDAIKEHANSAAKNKSPSASVR